MAAGIVCFCVYKSRSSAAQTQFIAQKVSVQCVAEDSRGCDDGSPGCFGSYDYITLRLAPHTVAVAVAMAVAVAAYCYEVLGGFGNACPILDT